MAVNVAVDDIVYIIAVVDVVVAVAMILLYSFFITIIVIIIVTRPGNGHMTSTYQRNTSQSHYTSSSHSCIGGIAWCYYIHVIKERMVLREMSGIWAIAG